VGKVAEAHAVAIAVAVHRHDPETVVSESGARRYRQRPAVQPVKAIDLQIVRQLAPTADAGADQDLVWGNVEFGQGHLDRV